MGSMGTMAAESCKMKAAPQKHKVLSKENPASAPKKAQPIKTK